MSVSYNEFFLKSISAFYRYFDACFRDILMLIRLSLKGFLLSYNTQIMFITFMLGTINTTVNCTTQTYKNTCEYNKVDNNFQSGSKSYQ